MKGRDLTGQASVYASKPEIKMTGFDKTKQYTVIMLDPDAPAGIWTHYVATVNADGSVLAEHYGYQAPNPPKGSGRHRYIFTLYNELKEVTQGTGQETGTAYYTRVLKPLLTKYKPIADPVQFTLL
jgi:phosphatidylethanolamine-binding protein (PEBP) family uncharacterized protein